jgi:membrane protein implicated in regulation of membrane protease activity
MATLIRYLFFQFPGWALAAVAAAALVHWNVIPGWLAGVALCALLIKDIVMFPFLRSAYESGAVHGSAALVGKKGIAQENLAPEGYVKIHLELWRAVADPPDQMIPAGTEVAVTGADGMKIYVRPAGRAVEGSKIKVQG